MSRARLLVARVLVGVGSACVVAGTLWIVAALCVHVDALGEAWGRGDD